MRSLPVVFCLVVFAAYAQGRCNYPGHVQNGSLRCPINLEENAKCELHCDRGHNLKGTKEIVCENGKWSGSLGKCEVVYCPTIKKVPVVLASPSSCFGQRSRYATACRFSCPEGYRGNGFFYCEETGNWTGRMAKCEDIRPPDIECPKDIVLQTDPGRPTAKLNLPRPSYSDNSQQYDPEAKLTFQSSMQLQSDVEIGRHFVKISVTDEAGNRGRCYFTVVVEDKEPPKIASCPKDITKTIGLNDNDVRIRWEEPRASDNSGEPVSLYNNYRNGARFRADIDYHVVYTARDRAWNEAKCRFKIHVKRECEDHNVPQFPCSTPAVDPSKCNQNVHEHLPILWKVMCRKTCKAC